MLRACLPVGLSGVQAKPGSTHVRKLLCSAQPLGTPLGPAGPAGRDAPGRGRQPHGPRRSRPSASTPPHITEHAGLQKENTKKATRECAMERALSERMLGVLLFRPSLNQKLVLRYSKQSWKSFATCLELSKMELGYFESLIKNIKKSNLFISSLICLGEDENLPARYPFKKPLHRLDKSYM